MSRRLALFLAACTGLFVSNIQADDVAALPGYNSTGSVSAVFGINPLTSTGTVTGGASTFIILPKPDGSKYYVVAKSSTNSITVVDTNFLNPASVASIETAPSAAAISPSGGTLVVAAGNLHLFETVKNQELVPGGISTGVNIFDVAISLDGTTAYALGTTTSGGSQVNAIDLVNNTKGTAQYGLLGTATGIAVGPNGRVYVSNQNQILELDPTTLQPTAGGVIGVNAQPGKLVFTPDGNYALAVNQTPVTGYEILLFSLTQHTLANFISTSNTVAPSVLFDTLLPVNSSTVYAYSGETQSLYQVNISGSGGSISLSNASVAGAPTTFVEGVAVSNEIPDPAVTTAHYLFIASANILYRVDLTVGQLTAQTTLPNQQFTALEYLAPESTNGSPVSLLAYGGNQIIAPNAESEPLVVLALDVNGKPLSGATITFSSNLGTLSNSSVTTAGNGYATTVLKAPSSNGTVTVTATSGKMQTTFTITVGSATVQPTGSISIVAGQGQLLTENVNTSIPGFGSPLEVLVTDLTGKPLSGVNVTFKIVSGTGSLFGGTVIPTGAVITSNASGIASAAFLTSVVQNGLGSSQTQITAQATGTNVLTFYETTYPTNTSFTPTVQFLTPQPGQTATGPNLTGQAGTVITGAFQAIVVDATGFAIPNVSMFACVPTAPTGIGQPGTCTIPAANSQPFGTCVDTNGNPTIPLSDAHGKINCNLGLNGVVGTSPIGAQYGYHFDTIAFPLTITPGPPGKITLVQGNNQTGKPGTQLPEALVIQITDSFGNVLSDYGPVTWTVLSSGVPATLQQTSNATNTTGSASTLVTLGSTVGVAIIQVTAGNASASFSVTVASTAASIQAVSGNNQSTFVGTAFAAPLIVKVVDALGNGVPGAPVTFTVSSGSAVVATPTATTDATGAASTAVTAGSTAGNITIVAASATFSTTFTLTSGQMGPQNIVFLNGTFFQIQPGCTSPGCVAPGEIVTIQGSGFANGVQGVVSGLSILGPLPVTLSGVSITFNGVAAPIFYVANVNGVQSLTVQVPFETPLGNTTVVLNAAGGGSATYTVPTQAYAPGVFTSTIGNQTILVAVRSDGSYVSPTNPAQTGEIIYVFVTGLGVTSPAAVTNEPGAGQAVTATVVTGLNNKGVPHTTVTYAPGLVGVYIVGVQVPANTETGPSQPFGLILVDPAGNHYFAASSSLPIANPPQ